MAYTGKFFYDPFATSGDRTTVPDTIQVGGQVSWPQGYGPDYSLDPESDPSAILIERQKFNFIMYEVTLSLAQLQTDYPQFVSATENGGAAFAYKVGAVARLPADGLLYQNTVAANTQSPPGNGWVIFLSQYALTSALNAEIARATAAEALLAPILSPNFGGTPRAPTAAPGAGGNILATLDYVISAVAAETSRAQGMEATLAPLVSPQFTGNARAPTQAPGNNSTTLATTAYTDGAVAVETARAVAVENSKAPLVSPALSGVPTTPTPPPTSSDTTIPNTAWVQARIPNVIQGSLMGGARFGVPIGGSFAIYNFTWDQPFPGGCNQAVASCETNDVFNPNAPGNNFTAIVYNFNANGGTVRVDTEQGLTPSGNVTVNVIGRGF